MAHFCSTIMVGLGAALAGSAVTGGCPFCASVWHIALAAFLSLILNDDDHIPLGIDVQHLEIGAAVHGVLALLYIGLGCCCCGTSGSCCKKADDGAKDKKKK